MIYTWSGHYRLNLPHLIRSKYVKLYRNAESMLRGMSVEEQVCIFDDCLNEVNKLLRDSFSRFVNTPEFAKCEELLLAAR